MSSRYKVLPTFKNESNSAPNEYWKPGAAAPGTDILQTEENFFVYNPKAHLAINSQKRLLPIANRRNELLYAVETHSVTIVVGETGSGKTTRF
ncbi:ATP-dependent RNA helicase [Bonamia ostreae]|uniref:ATP-dependent RNA helicase n=1 Tax=Bonamia ostreae TaxID=126728 RepID=A0ABV2AHW7_9EUKA